MNALAIIGLVGSIIRNALRPVKTDITKLPEGKNSTTPDIDLDLCDQQGNVLVRFKDGQIKTVN